MHLSDAIMPFRVRLPRYEHRQSWLPLLLDCYAVIDFSVAEKIKRSEKTVACRKGCSTCCEQIIPLSTLECLGLKFYVQNLLPQKYRGLLLKKFQTRQSMCLFNMAGSCIVYPFRPIACRRYIVCSQACRINEDPMTTRPEDVLLPEREFLYKAIAITLPFYAAQNLYPQENEPVFDFYKRQTVKLAEIYAEIIPQIPAENNADR